MAKNGAQVTVRGIVLGESSPSDIGIADGRIVSVGPAGDGPPGLGSDTAVIAPPLFDIQVNGVAGITLQGSDVRPEDVRAVTDTLASWGVGYWVPTLITASHEDMAHGCRMMVEAMADPVVRRAVPGIHLEGPFISPLDGPRGAHPEAHVRPPDIDEFDRLMEAAEGGILYITVAPEVEGAIAFIEAVAGRGVAVSLGHHAASTDHITAAVEAGAVLCTHLGNGCASLIHRHNNHLWPQLAEDRLAASLIADLEHLPPPMLKSMVRAKRPENVVLTSDCVHIAGMPPGIYSLGGNPVELTPQGRVCLSGTDLLAGSALMLLQGVVNAVSVAGMTLEEAYASATTIPGALFEIEHYFAAPAEGAVAEMVIFDIEHATPHGEPKIHAVFINGERKV